MSQLSVDLLSIDNYSGLQILQGADFFWSIQPTPQRRRQVLFASGLILILVFLT
jgi:hypothetical protein